MSYLIPLNLSFCAGFKHQNKAFIPPPLPPLPTEEQPAYTTEESKDHTTSINSVKVSKAEADKLISKSIANTLRNHMDTKRKIGKGIHDLSLSTDFISICHNRITVL